MEMILEAWRLNVGAAWETSSEMLEPHEMGGKTNPEI